MKNIYDDEIPMPRNNLNLRGGFWVQGYVVCKF